MDLTNAPPPSLAELIDLDVEPRRVWQAHDLGAILAHELSVPVRLEVGELAPPGTPAAGGANARPLSIGELLHHAAPPLELLVQLKRFAKAARGDSQTHLPEDVAGALYALAIAAALLRHGRRITSMSDRALVDYLAWALRRAWLDAASRQLLSDAARALGPGNAAGPTAPPA